MTHLDKKYDRASSPEEREKAVKPVLKIVLDRQLQDTWTKKLSSQYGITRNRMTPQKRKVFSLGRTRRILAIAASITLFFLVGRVVLFSPSDPKQIAEEYLHAREVLHPGLVKGVADIQYQFRGQAIKFFDEKKYEDAALYFRKIENQTSEDKFYLSLSYLFDGQYEEAIDLLNALKTPNSSFREEINWYISVAYILNDQSSKALSSLHKIRKGEWNYSESQNLISLMTTTKRKLKKPEDL